jgi:hypothetical protein
MLIVGLVLSCSKGEDKAAVRVGDDVITVGQMKAEYLAVSAGARPRLATIDEQEQFARDVVSKEILEIEGREMGLDRLPEVQQAVQQEARRKAWQVFYEENVRSKVSVSEDELREAYETQGDRYHLAWMFVRSGDLARELARRIQAGEDFETLASIHSVDASRVRKGDIGTRALGSLPSDVASRITGMSPGEVSEPIEYSGHYVLVKMYEKEEVEKPDFESLRSGLEALVRTRRETALQRTMAEEFKVKRGLTFNDEAIDVIVSKTKELYPNENVAPGKIPDFSDEELSRVVALYDGGEWRIRVYVELLKAQNDFLRPGYGTDRESIKTLIGDFITGELWTLEIEERGYHEHPEVTRRVTRAMEEAIVTAMHQQLVRSIEVTEDDLMEFYEEHKEEMVTDPGVRLAVITTQSEQEAEEMYGLLQGGADFENLAAERSFDRASGESGGAIRTPIYKRQLEQFPSIYEVVENLNEGNYSRPIAVPAGFLPGEFVILKVLEKIESMPMEFDDVTSLLNQQVLQMEQERVFGEWLTGKLAEYEVEIYPDALADIDFEKLRTQE